MATISKLTAKERRDVQARDALWEFALAVKALPVPVSAKAEILIDALWAINYLVIVQLRCVSKQKFGSCDEYSSNRTERRFIYRKLLTACGVNARHV